MTHDIGKSAGARIALLFKSHSASDYIGEPVTILEHSWQAYKLSKEKGEDADVSLACLLHDIGHMLGMEAGFPPGMKGCGTPNHEGIAKDFLLSLGFSPLVAHLVGNHVNAKRYLVYKDENYPLSDASKVTLGFQGGPMTREEAEAAEADPHWSSVLRMRGYDEGAKEPGQPQPDVDKDIVPLVEAHVRAHTVSSAVSSSVQHVRYRLSTEQLRFYKERGLLVVRGLLNVQGITEVALSDMADALLGAGQDVPEGRLVHRELVRGQEQACRVENFSRETEAWRDISETLSGVCAQLFGENEAVLFKDKLNYKLSGGGSLQS